MPRERLSAKLERAVWPDGSPDWCVPTIDHFCPGCGYTHQFAVERPFRGGAQWTWNGDVDRPTFSPSMVYRIGPRPDGSVDVCHYFLHGGRIQFLGDCTHELRGQTVDLPDLPSTGA